MNEYNELIVVNNLPFTIVEDANFQKISKHSKHFARSTIRKTMIKVKELVEKRILVQLHSARCGAISHDGWTYRGG